MNRPIFRRVLALCVCVITLWTAFVTAGANSLSTAATAIKSSTDLAIGFLRWELGDFFGTDILSAANVLALRQSPHLLAQRAYVVSLMGQALEDPVIDPAPQEETEEPHQLPPDSTVQTEDLTFADNGVPSQTVIPSAGGAYTIVNGAYIKNTSSRVLDSAALAAETYSSKLSGDGPQVLIVHSHGSEAYSMPPGEEYVSSGTYRTADTNCNVVRIGDEIASVLSTYGISVLHDRTLHDVPSYNEAYNSSLASIESYLEKYPSLVYVLDIHRDAIQDAEGKQYKLISSENPIAAQCCLVMGLAHDTWQHNMTLAIAVQQTLVAQNPTLMRPIAARGYRYNQHLPVESLLVEIGAAGNSLDEAILGARLFAKGFAETILPQ